MFKRVLKAESQTKRHAETCTKIHTVPLICINTKSAVPFCPTLMRVQLALAELFGPKINDWLCSCLIRLEVLCPGWSVELSWSPPGRDLDQMVKKVTFVLTRQCDFVRTCLSKILSTFTSEQTFSVCRQRLGTLGKCSNPAAWTPAVWEAVELQKELFQAWLAMFSSVRAWVSSRHKRLCRPEGCCGCGSKWVCLARLWWMTLKWFQSE